MAESAIVGGGVKASGISKAELQMWKVRMRRISSARVFRVARPITTGPPAAVACGDLRPNRPQAG